MFEKNKSNIKYRKVKNVSSSKIKKPKKNTASNQELSNTSKEERSTKSKKSKGSHEIDSLFMNLKSRSIGSNVLDNSNQMVR